MTLLDLTENRSFGQNIFQFDGSILRSGESRGWRHYGALIPARNSAFLFKLSEIRSMFWVLFAHAMLNHKLDCMLLRRELLIVYTVLRSDGRHIKLSSKDPPSARKTCQGHHQLRGFIRDPSEWYRWPRLSCTAWNKQCASCGEFVVIRSILHYLTRPCSSHLPHIHQETSISSPQHQLYCKRLVLATFDTNWCISGTGPVPGQIEQQELQTSRRILTGASSMCTARPNSS